MILVLLLLSGAAFVLVRSARREHGFRPELGPVGWVNGTRWSVVAPLARAELRRLLLHPAFVFGFVITPLFLFLATGVDASDRFVRLSGAIALGLAPFGWFTIAATQLLTTRGRRTGADSLLASLPAPQPTRTAALLATMPGPVALAALFAAANVALLAAQERDLGSPDLREIASGLLLAAGAVAVGVAVGRFLPHPLFAVGGVVAVILIQARFLDPTTWPWNSDEASPIRFFGFLANPTSAPPELEYRPAAWHLVYLAGLVGVMAVVALAREGMPRALGGGLALAVVTTLVGAWMQAQPASEARVAEMVSYLENAASHQHCVERPTGRFCSYDGSGQQVKLWDARAASVLARVPTKPRSLEVIDRVPTIVGNSSCSPIPFTKSLIPTVARQIDPARVWAEDGAVHPGGDTLSCSSTSVNGLFFAIQVGSWAVGLPSSPGAGDHRCYADDEARSAIALWLGLQATPGGSRTLQQIAAEEFDDHLAFSGWTDPPMFGVRFAAADVRVALAMAERPAGQVAAQIAPHWTRLTAPRTPTSELAVLLGLSARAAVAPTTPGCA